MHGNREEWTSKVKERVRIRERGYLGSDESYFQNPLPLPFFNLLYLGDHIFRSPHHLPLDHRIVDIDRSGPNSITAIKPLSIKQKIPVFKSRVGRRLIFVVLFCTLLRSF